MKDPIVARRAALAIALLVAASLAVPPARAHVSETVQHLWTQHLKPLAKRSFFTKARSDSRYLRDQVRTGHAGCGGLGFHPITSDITYGSSGASRFASVAGPFHCNADIPDGATVQEVTFSLSDTSVTERVRGRLLRVDLASGAIVAMTEVETGEADASGEQLLSDVSVTASVVDNATYSYLLEGIIFGTGVDVTFRGATIRYTIPGEDGAAT